ncbi:hypothetical protein [Ferrimonas aestuarii]|uniref:Uncharacterized protein n=1 Tax=Ferrimonas aestuarii TaxID=2569539 RepID=A0A4U1BTS9_9GAMM|nr:hypothetical protein [Ferrimonas aestuarii]TKB58602.1 hypothetical protein FCL42_02310 [Ferrimonas aestuarii]
MLSILTYVLTSAAVFAVAIELMCRMQAALIKHPRTKAKLYLCFGIPLVICLALGLWVLNLHDKIVELGFSESVQFLLLAAAAGTVIGTMFITSDRRYSQLDKKISSWVYQEH